MRGLFIIVYGIAQAKRRDPCIYTEKELNKYHVAMMMAIHVKLKPWETQNRTILKK